MNPFGVFCVWHATVHNSSWLSLDKTAVHNMFPTSGPGTYVSVDTVMLCLLEDPGVCVSSLYFYLGS